MEFIEQVINGEFGGSGRLDEEIGSPMRMVGKNKEEDRHGSPPFCVRIALVHLASSLFFYLLQPHHHLRLCHRSHLPPLFRPVTSRWSFASSPFSSSSPFDRVD
ncbi:hypothetical protein K1719_046935 [Acacia pycnantha]|nr:hypothetical protein K1719_046935 [Acacia pycnantha]